MTTIADTSDLKSPFESTVLPAELAYIDELRRSRAASHLTPPPDAASPVIGLALSGGEVLRFS